MADTQFENFMAWLKEKHPDIELLPWQEQSALYYFYHIKAFISGIAMGKTFLQNLIKEYENDR